MIIPTVRRVKRQRLYGFKYRMESPTPVILIKLLSLLCSPGAIKFMISTPSVLSPFAVVQWVDVFTRKEYVDTVVESLKFCQRLKV
ncbi:MAG: hypothetical protein JWN56_1233 [Sphingobacteriales bacterium]|nr:hypothetical protein [Sphingobacteriales bacterium]